MIPLSAGAALTIMKRGSRARAVVLIELKREMPTQVERPNIIHGVEIAPTALAREGSSTWNLCSHRCLGFHFRDRNERFPCKLLALVIQDR